MALSPVFPLTFLVINFKIKVILLTQGCRLEAMQRKSVPATI
jgi:hypothetical protein